MIIEKIEQENSLFLLTYVFPDQSTMNNLINIYQCKI